MFDSSLLKLCLLVNGKVVGYELAFDLLTRLCTFKLNFRFDVLRLFLFIGALFFVSLLFDRLGFLGLLLVFFRLTIGGRLFLCLLYERSLIPPPEERFLDVVVGSLL